MLSVTRELIGYQREREKRELHNGVRGEESLEYYGSIMRPDAKA